MVNYATYISMYNKLHVDLCVLYLDHKYLFIFIYAHLNANLCRRFFFVQYGFICFMLTNTIYYREISVQTFIGGDQQNKFPLFFWSLQGFPKVRLENSEKKKKLFSEIAVLGNNKYRGLHRNLKVFSRFDIER